MRPKKLSLCAWGPYPDKEEIDFTAFDERGIFLITGATGAGKTTIFDAITYALYGALSGDERDKERNSVRSDFAQPTTPTYVELIMEHGGKVYEIHRNPEYLRPQKRGNGKFTKEKENAVLYYPDGRILEGAREVNEALEGLLGLDYQQFKKISMIAQGEFARLLVASPKEKTGIFREIFGTGIYERFTQGLSVRARALYAKVSEHKTKLVEDIRHLSTDMGRRCWDEEVCLKLESLMDAEYPNYEALTDCMAGMEQTADAHVKAGKKKYEEVDKEVERLTSDLTEQEQNNQNLERLKLVKKEQEELRLLVAEVKEKESRLSRAQKAGIIEQTEAKQEQLVKRIASNEEEREHNLREQCALKEEQAELAEVVEQAPVIRELLQQKQLLEQTESQMLQLRNQLAEKEANLHKGQKEYQERESAFRKIRAEYEGAQHRRNLEVIGLAATLLEEGKPCPVCGSIEHPSPANVCEEVMSREELDLLKGKVEEREKCIHSFHEELITLKIQVDTERSAGKDLEDKAKDIRTAFDKTENTVCREYLELSVERGLKTLQGKCDRAGQIRGLLEEKSTYAGKLSKQQEELAEEQTKIHELLQQQMKEYGFADFADYRRAKLSVEGREALQQEILNYHRSVAANEELCAHLEQVTKGKVYVDLAQTKEMLQQARTEREQTLKVLKLWEQNLSEVKKTEKLVSQKLKLIEADSVEYGYVKDLENMATGNNAKKLVFEQYVLAGYFEEILRAANIRFRKMTAGRYEMERVGQVSDGRIKDNLEIQVMDFYTGKYRSVRTLSGGESFKASLALALGMSDVIQAMNGGIRVDTLFVDEGFGALDEESLNQACDTLMSLVEKNRLIGIISHVGELRERIEQQLIIDKTGSGSTIRNRVK